MGPELSPSLLRQCKIVMLSRFVALSVSLIQKVSLFQGGVGPGNNFRKRSRSLCVFFQLKGSGCTALRGHKMEPWEGGTRVVAFLSGGWLPSSLRNTTNDHFIHIADWCKCQDIALSRR